MFSHLSLYNRTHIEINLRNIYLFLLKMCEVNISIPRLDHTLFFFFSFHLILNYIRRNSFCMLWFFWVLAKEATILQIATIVQSHQTKAIETLVSALARFFYKDNYCDGRYSP